jgi:inosine-uridine nucleoside N-ribohydrolase
MAEPMLGLPCPNCTEVHMRDLIVETDLGHDPDDFFTICYLAAVGVRIRAITVVPGDRDQIAIARLLVKELGLDIPVGASKPGSRKFSSGGVHHELLGRFRHPLEADPDGPGAEVIAATVARYPDCEFLVIGPCTCTARYLSRPDARVPRRLTMQGGFLGYHLHEPTVRLPEFEGRTWMPTFNLNGDRKGAEVLLRAPIAERRFVGKNVCHTLKYDRAFHATMPPAPPGNPAAVLFALAMGMYLRAHEEKKWHDPTAAALHLHPELGTWVRGRVAKIEAGWGTIPDESGDLILADVDRDALWSCFRDWK